MKTEIRLFALLIIVISFFNQCDSLFPKTEYGGYREIPDEEYDFIKNISDTIKLIDTDSNIFILSKYKEELEVKNVIHETENSPDSEYEFEHYKVYYKSDSIEIRIGIIPEANFVVQLHGFDYRYEFFMDADYTSFFLWKDEQEDFNNDSIVDVQPYDYINDNHSGKLKVQKSTGIIFVQTSRGRMLYQYNE